MGYLLVGILLLIIVGTAIAVAAKSASRQGRQQGTRAAEDSSYGAGVPGSDTGIFATDADSPLGDTSELSGQQSEGETVTKGEQA